MSILQLSPSDPGSLKNDLHVAVLTLSRVLWMQAACQKKKKSTKPTSLGPQESAHSLCKQRVISHHALWVRGSWLGIIELTEPGWPLSPPPGIFRFVNFHFSLLT